MIFITDNSENEKLDEQHLHLTILNSINIFVFGEIKLFFSFCCETAEMFTDRTVHMY